MFGGVFVGKSAVQCGDAVDEADVDIGVDLSHLVEVDSGEEAVSPSEGCVGVDDEVWSFFSFCDDIFEDASAEGV